jgi:hypothetical protein
MDNLYQTPPQNIELEESVLNSCLSYPEDIVFDISPKDIFNLSRPPHKTRTC